ncbi:DNA-binding response regulator [Flavobacterium branchiophilum NBRC 15030 = ATCC 35035]|uniref:Two-component system alkaline phosphatase synthesis response regulator PhoP n=2 Tax=Flavobacterium branchiophilum TaxID=55197 RepID=A0A543G4A1_9FLAO|nr:two-component system alkaline phosphatase synthesis response regulator PhoP [Flavobacterium branchiophilum]GEM54817.1 DNA-binding response regulator [Flavobacterium branchiophilum NBRC 15030 = ATCC 35035]
MGFNIEKRYNNRNIDYINMKKLKTKILIVDDDVDILEIISYNLNQEGYQVMTATNGVEAIAKAKSEKPHLILLDIMMPVMDGMEACEQIRKIPELKDILIAFLTARNEDYSQVAGFERGADDYITKPIKPKLLMSRIKGLLRRNTPQEETSNIQTIGSIQIDKEAYKIIKDHIEIILPRKEFELICLLASKPGKVFSREEILETIWGNDVVVGGRTIDVHIRKLREKLGNNNFVTIKGVGYKLIG